MNNRMKLVAGITAFAAFIVICVFLYQYLSKNYTPDNGLSVKNESSSVSSADSAQTDLATDSSAADDRIAAVDFTMTDVEGNEVKLSDFYGKPIVLNFWASWCPPCKSEMPEFNAVSEELEGEVVFLMVNATDGQRETVEKASAYIEEEGYTFPVYYDTMQSGSYTYGVSSLPSTLFIDPEGYVTAGYRGAINEETLRAGIDTIYTK